jgi:hypothetical protein
MLCLVIWILNDFLLNLTGGKDEMEFGPEFEQGFIRNWTWL